MDKHRIHELLARKLAGEATQLEIDELNELMAKYPDSIYYDEILGQLWLKSPSTEMMPEIDIVYHCHQDKYKNELAHAKRLSLTALNIKTKISLISALLIILIAGLFVFTTKDTAASKIQIIAGKGMRKKINLPDGTIVWLNSDSKLTYNTTINEDKKRVVFLTGEAYFDVAHHLKRPFFVRTNKISIKVLGTKFNVKAYATDQKSEATLINGSIELSVNNKPEQKIILNPSEKFALVEKKETGEKQKVVPNDITLMIENVNPVQIGNQVYIEETSWKDSKLVFRNETFEEMKPKLERWYNVKIHLKSQKTGSYRFTGVLKDENIEEALTAMQLIKPFNFKLTDHDVIIH
ncbi:FecR family protein [Pedobacter immunditicola]|uniref:FecR family protein n=1 Tax=Pedobacter immunditicola TaxID=3133440 RepID=UPI00309816CD